MSNYLITPSLLAANFACLGEEAKTVLAAGGDRLHIDVMDNHYVPNLTIGPLVCSALRQYGIKAPLDVHLMTQPVDKLIVAFSKAGATSITFHPEASDHIDRSLELIHQHGCQAGLALNPATTPESIQDVIDKIDLILVMSVNPGFGGQTFIPSTLEKLQYLRQLIDESGRNIRLAIDGGINVDNIYQVAMAGADTFIAGSAIFSQPNYATVINKMCNELKRVT